MILREVSLGDQVYALLKERIINGHYNPGEIIIESEVAKDLSVSRTPVSNAFIMLKERGLLEYEANKYKVIKLSLKNVVDLYKCRLAFDGLATSLAAKRIEVQDLRELETLLSNWDASQEDDSANDLWVIDLSFHEKIYALSNNSHLIRFSNIATEILSVYRRVNIAQLPRNTNDERRSRQDVAREHYAIFKALEQRDSELAEKAARDHIHNVIANLQSLSHLDLD